MDAGRAFLDGAVDSSALPVNVGGRPTDYTPEIAAKICEAIASNMKIREVASLPGFPGKSTMFLWLAQHEDFRSSYAAAMEWRTEEDMDWLMDLATDSSADWKLDDAGENSVPIKVLDKTAIERSKLAVETLKWRIVRRQPHKYRDPDKPQAVIMPPAQPGQPQPGDDARLIGYGTGTIEAHPMQDAIEAWRKVRLEAGLK